MTAPLPGDSCPQCNNPIPANQPALCPKCHFPLLLVKRDDEFEATAREGLRRPTEKLVEAPRPRPMAAPQPGSPVPPRMPLPPVPSRPCPRCGLPNALSADACPRCGISLRTPPPPPRRPPTPARRQGPSAGRVVLTILLILVLLLLAGYYYLSNNGWPSFDFSQGGDRVCAVQGCR